MWVVRRNWSRASAGVLQPRVFRGLLLRAIATAARASALCTLRSVPFGKYWRSSPPIGVLVRAALPGTVGIAEVDAKPGVDPQVGMLGHLRPLIPGQRSSQLLGQGGDRARD